MFIGEHNSGSLTKFESRDVTFLENDFPQQGDINKDLSFYETMDLVIKTHFIRMGAF